MTFAFASVTRHTPDNFSMDSYMEAASLSKWGTAMILAGMVQDGTLRFTDQANKHVKHLQ